MGQKKKNSLFYQIIITAILLAAFFWIRDYIYIENSKKDPHRYKRAHYEIYGNIPVLHLYGTHREMGEQYGTLMKKPLRVLFSFLNISIPEIERKKMLMQAREIEKNLSKPIRDELQAISDASGISYMELVALNVSPRLMCSALAAWGKATEDGKMVLGRNSDFHSFGLSNIAGLIVVYHPKKGHDTISIGYIGSVGIFTGINEKKLAFASMLSLNAREPVFDEYGVPVQMLLRQASTEYATAIDLSEFLITRKHIVPVNVIAADETEAMISELSIRYSHIRMPKHDYIAASNYFISKNQAAAEVDCSRYRSLIESVKEYYGKYDIFYMRKALYDARVKNMNIQAVIINPSSNRIYISINHEPASKGPYMTFDLKKLFYDFGDPVISKDVEKFHSDRISELYE